MTFFEEEEKKFLIDKFANSPYIGSIKTPNFEKDENIPQGVKIFDKLQKNLSSATEYNLISNLSMS